MMNELRSMELDKGTETHSEESIRGNLERAAQHRTSGDYDEALTLALEGFSSAEELKHDELAVEALYQIGLINYFLHNFDQARANFEIGLTRAKTAQLENLEADLLNAQGVVEWKQGNLSLATLRLKEALLIHEKMQHWESMASISSNLGIIAHSLHDYPTAVDHYRKGLEQLGDLKNERLKANLLSNLAESLIPLNELEEAEAYLAEALELEISLKDPHNLALTYFNLGELRSKQGDSEKALALYQKALDLQLSLADRWGEATTRWHRASEYWKSGNADQALEELSPGYLAVKDLNLLSLLRDYAQLYSEIYGGIGEDGLSRYYEELHTWFAERVRTDEGAHNQSPESLSTPVILEAAIPAGNTSDSTIRKTTIALLGIVILILILENVRLRRREPRL